MFVRSQPRRIANGIISYFVLQMKGTHINGFAVVVAVVNVMLEPGPYPQSARTFTQIPSIRV